MKRWHTHKTKPKANEDIIAIYNDNSVYIENTAADEYGRLIILDGENGCFLWKDIKDTLKLWAYVAEYFEKELK